MDHNLEHRIRERAYEIWTAHGCINGQADQHWLAAERELLMETTTVTRKHAIRQKGRFRASSKSRKAIAG
jgi:Protein of unknown function (DUF2934)